MVLSAASAFVAIAAFVISSLASARGADVTLFPIGQVGLFRDSEHDRLGLLVSTDFANTATGGYPDAIVHEQVDVRADGVRFTCFSSQGDARVLLSEARARARGLPLECSEARCVAVGPNHRSFIALRDDAPERHTVRAGEITSLSQYFNGDSTWSTDACASFVENGGSRRPTLRDLVGDRASRRQFLDLSIDFTADLLHEGRFTAHCDARIAPETLAKLTRDGYGQFVCANNGVHRTSRGVEAAWLATLEQAVHFAPLLGLLLALVSAFIAREAIQTQIRTTHFGKIADVIVDCNRRYDEIHQLREALEESARKNDNRRSDRGNQFYRAYWGLQWDQWVYFHLGLVPSKVLARWFAELGRARNDEVLGKTLRLSWSDLSDGLAKDFAKDDGFPDFVSDVFKWADADPDPVRLQAQIEVRLGIEYAKKYARGFRRSLSQPVRI